jgi:hypothetical protein
MADLALAAHQQGRAAAETCRREGQQQPPALLGPQAPPESLTRVLLGCSADEKPSKAQMQTVATEWTRGVTEVWEASR